MPPQGLWMSGAQQAQGRGGSGHGYGAYNGGPQYPPPGYMQPSVRYA